MYTNEWRVVHIATVPNMIIILVQCYLNFKITRSERELDGRLRYMIVVAAFAPALLGSFTISHPWRGIFWFGEISLTAHE